MGTYIKTYYTKIILLLSVTIFLTQSAFAQDGSEKKQPLPKISIGDIKDVVKYDPETGKYLYFKKGSEDKPYKVLTKEDFDKESVTKSFKESFRRKREEGNEGVERGRGILPRIRTNINSETLGNVLGGNDFNIDFNGRVELIFGIKSTKINNPIIPPEYRRTTSPDFRTNYQLNLTGNLGSKINFNFNFDPNNSFGFDTDFKVGYSGDEDAILQNIEVGYVALPVNSTLISGSQSLFGAKLGLRFGRLDMDLVASQQKGESKTVEVRGGAQSQFFDIRADEYEQNRHFFLTQYFRDNYEKSLAQLPLITSGVNITKLEVWVTNRSNSTKDVRNVVAFMDLAETDKIYNKVPGFGSSGARYPGNQANGMYNALINQYNIRNFATINSSLQPLGQLAQPFYSGQDYEKLERARRLESSEFFFNPQLGYISLNTSLNNDEVLAVAFEYTINGQIFKVGELSTDGTTGADSTLVLKLLKGTTLTPRLPSWNLMMKNVYRLEQAYNLEEKNFILDIFYEDSEVGTGIPYLPEGPKANVPLINVLNLDKLNTNRDAFPDGIFDFVEGVTVQKQYGRIIFPVLEPFGAYLEKTFKGDPAASKYVYRELYDSTITKAREFSHKNKFMLQGSFESSSQNEIRLDAMNIPEGSVVVTAGGTKLIENIDYQVNYLAGTVTITNPGYLESGIPIQIKLESRNTFNLQTKTLLGANLNYRITDKFRVGGTILHLNEKPMTQKVAYNEDPISNTIWGLNTSFSTESEGITKFLSKIIDTKAKSSFFVEAEIANLIAGQPRGIKGKLFIDDFEGSKSSLDLRNYLAWTLASVPQGQKDLFPEGDLFDDRAQGYNRAKLAWNWIDPELLRKPIGYMRQNPDKYLKNHFVREVTIKEIYPNRALEVGLTEHIQTLNLNYYPKERGSYNYDQTRVDFSTGKLNEPEKRWGGIMRSLPITDFESANYDYIEFWVMDPFVYNKDPERSGDFYINLGTISEDVLRDGHKSYEQGIPYPLDQNKVIATEWGYVPKDPALVNNFDNSTKANKDVGLDGMKSSDETKFFSRFAEAMERITDPKQRLRYTKDPSSDDFVYYRDARYDNEQSTILERYKDFNNTEGNSTGNDIYTNSPDMEDINRDNTMEENETYYQYRIPFSPNMKVGENFIAEAKDTLGVTWYQFKIPLNEYERTVGPISDFKSVRFMRMYLRGFKDTTVMRFASLELVRSEWRKYGYSLVKGQEGITTPEVPNSSFEVSVVNIEENSQRAPVNYVMPPNTERTVDPSSYQERQLNEQSMQITVRNLPDGDGRAVYKTLDYDLRQYRRLQMDVHAESFPTDVPINNGDLSLFLRIGSDLINNYYEYEIPLKVTAPGFYSDNQRYLVWPEENMLDIDLAVFSDIKMFRNTSIKENGGAPNVMYEKDFGKHIVRVKGNPNLGEVRTMMIGVNNPIDKNNTAELGMARSGSVWVNELRLSDFENKGGWAATARTGVQLADLGSITLSGSMMTAGFGGLEQRQSERSQEDVYSYDLMTNLNLGKFFSPKAGIQIPIFFGISERFANPLYDPLSKDVKYKDAMKNLTTKLEKDSLRNLAQDYTRRKTFSINNFRVAPEGSKGGILSISNLSLNFAFNELFSHNVNLERMLQKDYRGGLTYGYNIAPKYIKPFAKVGFLNGKALKFIGDFNFNPVPNSFTFTGELHRMYYERQSRNIAYPDAKMPATYSKDFTFTRFYNLNWNLAESLNFTYSATNVARIDEPEGMVDRKRDREGYKHWRDSVWSNIANFGRTVNFNHNFMFSWQVPINKIYGMDWVNATTSYSARYNWAAAPIMSENEFGYEFDPGNIIDNGRNINGNVSLNFTALYNKSNYLKKVNDKFDRKKTGKPKKIDVVFESRKLSFTAGRKRVITHDLKTTDVKIEVTDASGKKLRVKSESSGPNKVVITVAEEAKGAVVKVTGKVDEKENAGKYALDFLTRLAMSVRQVSINYNQDESSILPGFKGETKLFGLKNFKSRLAPGISFVMGGQASDFARRARDNGWLTGDSTMTNPYVMRKSTNLNFQIQAEPIKDLQISLTGMRTHTTDHTSYDITQAGGLEQVLGGFQISTITIGSAFERNSEITRYSSNAFEKFNKIRKSVAWELANDRLNRAGGRYNPGGKEFPDGYDGASQEVLLPAFRAAYMGGSANSKLSNFWNIPLPNWQLSYQGFNRADFFKRYFNSGRITHAYTSIYSVNSYNRNAEFAMESDGLSWTRNQLGNFIARDNVLNVSIQESFNPLFGLDLGWKNDLSTGFKFNKNRTIGLSLANNQVVEAKNNIFSIELGYFFRKVPLIFKFGENKRKKVDTDLKLTGRFSFGNERTFIRNLDETDREAQISAGSKITRFNLSADYTVYKGVMLRMFFDHDFTNPYITSISVSNTNFGFSLSFSLSE